MVEAQGLLLPPSSALLNVNALFRIEDRGGLGQGRRRQGSPKPKVWAAQRLAVSLCCAVVGEKGSGESRPGVWAGREGKKGIFFEVAHLDLSLRTPPPLLFLSSLPPPCVDEGVGSSRLGLHTGAYIRCSDGVLGPLF